MEATFVLIHIRQRLLAVSFGCNLGLELVDQLDRFSRMTSVAVARDPWIGARQRRRRATRDDLPQL
jgi:hypothetical protein